MNTPVTIICMKWGDKYDASYVNKLYNMVSRNLSKEFRFICLTDDNSDFLPAIESFDIPKLNLPEGILKGVGLNWLRFPNIFLISRDNVCFWT